MLLRAVTGETDRGRVRNVSIWFVIVLLLLAFMAGAAVVTLLRIGRREGRTRRNINLDPGIATYTHGEEDIATSDRIDEPRRGTESPEPPDQAR